MIYYFGASSHLIILYAFIRHELAQITTFEHFVNFVDTICDMCKNVWGVQLTIKDYWNKMHLGKN